MKILCVNDNLTLRQLTRDDASDIFTSIDTQRRHLGRWLPFVEHTLRVEDTMQVVQAMMTATPYEYIFTLRLDDRFIGLAGFKKTNPTTGTTEIGYWMREEHQRRGFMTNAVRVLCQFAFEELGLRCIEIRCATGNGPSNCIPQRLGFRLDRIEVHAEELTGGEWVDLNVYMLEKETTPRAR